MEVNDIKIHFEDPDELDKYLNGPPNWEDAEKHALANRVVDISRTKL
jgi:hypothetical protein